MFFPTKTNKFLFVEVKVTPYEKIQTRRVQQAVSGRKTATNQQHRPTTDHICNQFVRVGDTADIGFNSSAQRIPKLSFLLVLSTHMKCSS
jgi:hypothetical protein